MAAKFLDEKFQQFLPYDVDGLIFQPYDMAYIPGRCDRALKWKPPSHCTIDFRLRVKNSMERKGDIPQTSGKLFVGGHKQPFGELKWSTEYDKYNGKIIECRYDCQLGKWIFQRLRTDKNYPNHYTTAESVFVAVGIEQPLTQEDLMNYTDALVRCFEDGRSDEGTGIQGAHLASGCKLAVDHIDDSECK